MSIFCWGRGEDGQLGLGDTADQSAPVRVEFLPPSKVVVQVACGSGHTVALTDEGSVYTWGRGDDGRLGHGDHGWKYVPYPVLAFKEKRISHVACGSYHTAAVSEAGELFTWGGGMFGKLGHGDEAGHSTPCLVQALRGRVVKQVACGSRHTVALLSTGEVCTWGDRESGVSGHGDAMVEGYQFLPRVLEALAGKTAVQVSACGFHSCVLLDGGEVYSWGDGKFGRLGHGSESTLGVPRIIDRLRGVRITQVSCGGFHTAAVCEEGQCYTWGGGEHGQLGHGDKSNRLEPHLVVGLPPSRGRTIVACGWSHTVALTVTGEVFAWGNGDHGKLGLGDASKVSTPRAVESLRGLKVLSVASYNEHSAALVEARPEGLTATGSPSLTATYFQHMGALLDRPDFSDVCFLVEGMRVHAHRAVLAARSDHFRALFASGMRDAAGGECEVELEGISHAAFSWLLRFLYTNNVDVSPSDAVELYSIADMFTVSVLKDLCEARVRKGLTIPTAAELLVRCDVHPSCAPLRAMCLRFIVSHFDAVTKTNTFSLLSKSQMLEILGSR